MKILRSQYLQMQRNAAADQQNFPNDAADQQNVAKDAATKVVPSKGKTHPLPVAPTQMLRKKDIVCFKAGSSTPLTNIKILIKNTDGTLKKLNVVLEYVDMSSLWLTNLYKTYENDLWRKKLYLDVHGNKKKLYYCGLCSNIYKSFCSLKSHLNLHLNLHPYICKICLKKYTSRKSATEHLRKFHNLQKQQYNDYLTS